MNAEIERLVIRFTDFQECISSLGYFQSPTRLLTTSSESRRHAKPFFRHSKFHAFDTASQALFSAGVVAAVS